VFIDDSQFRRLWPEAQRYYLFAEESELPHLESLVGRSQLHVVRASGGKLLVANYPAVP
jgi:hypothetical protein